MLKRYKIEALGNPLQKNGPCILFKTVETDGDWILASVGQEMYDLLKVAACPDCSGSGAYHDNMGEVRQCQFCYEREQVLAKAEGAE